MWGERGQERLVGDERRRLQGAQGDKEERGGREDRQRGGGGHTPQQEKHGDFGARRAMGVVRSWPGPLAHSSGGGAMVETIWIPGSSGERDG